MDYVLSLTFVRDTFSVRLTYVSVSFNLVSCRYRRIWHKIKRRTKKRQTRDESLGGVWQYSVRMFNTSNTRDVFTQRKFPRGNIIYVVPKHMNNIFWKTVYRRRTNLFRPFKRLSPSLHRTPSPWKRNKRVSRVYLIFWIFRLSQKRTGVTCFHRHSPVRT